MVKTGMIAIVCAAAGISAAIAATTAEDGRKAVAGSATAAWAANEVHALYDPAKRYAMVDVNDKFVLKSRADGESRTLSLGVLDGARAKIGDCAKAAQLKDGDPRTTWLDVTYTQLGAGDATAFTIRRSLDFAKHDRVYRFTAADGAMQQLEPGVSVRFNDGVLVYEQTTGPLGASGKTKALRVAYKLAKDFGDVTAAVEMDRQAWTLSSNRASASATPLYSVNNVAVLPHVAGTKGVLRDRAIIAAPLPGPGIGADSAPATLKVSGGVSKSVGGLQVSDEATKALCFSTPCSFDFQCNRTSTSCLCHDLDGPGPLLGVCQV